jgi:LAO/AO transport system kinase
MAGTASPLALQDTGTESQAPPGLALLIDRLRDGDVAALGRALSLLDVGGEVAQQLTRALCRAERNALVIGVTGPPGAGKSTLISAYIRHLREAGRTVDPSSPKSGGAVLGDRARMGDHVTDPGVFVRSLSARGHLGGLTLNIHALVSAVDAAGWQVIILETVGAGQSEVEICRVVDTTIVVNAPGLGDDVQAMKAGILEVADVLVVNKADLPGADNTVQQLEGMLALRADSERNVPVIPTTATGGDGIDALARVVDEICTQSTPADRASGIHAHVADLIADAAAKEMREMIGAAGEDRLHELTSRLLRGEIDLTQAARIALATVGVKARQ